jgi:hypothetical protein
MDILPHVLTEVTANINCILPPYKVATLRRARLRRLVG